MFAKAAKPGSQIDISSIERYVLVGADDAIRAYLSNESNQARREEAWNNLLGMRFPTAFCHITNIAQPHWTFEAPTKMAH